MSSFGEKLVQGFGGNLSLVITFWIYAVLIPNVGLYLSFWLLLTLTNNMFADVIVIVGHYIYTIYYIFIFMSLWQSARQYTGMKVWSVLALLITLFWGLLTIVSVTILHGT